MLVHCGRINREYYMNDHYILKNIKPVAKLNKLIQIKLSVKYGQYSKDQENNVQLRRLTTNLSKGQGQYLYPKLTVHAFVIINFYN